MPEYNTLLLAQRNLLSANVAVTVIDVVPVPVTVYGPPDVVNPPMLLATSNSMLAYILLIPPLGVVKHTLLTVANVAEIFLSIKLETVPVTEVYSPEVLYNVNC